METVRIGVIGLGGMGSKHAEYIVKGEAAHARLTAVCDGRPERLVWAKETFGDSIAVFGDPEALLASGSCDAIIIATPHFDHPSLAVKAFRHGLHAMSEKPAGVYTKQVREMNEAAAESGRVFGIMYNQRTNPLYQKVKDIVSSGEMGAIKRSNWIITNWYRPQSYFDSGGWRATWAGEGGGVLLNQDPHQLDLWQWICGMLVRVRAFCSVGKFHDIEVEDDVTAYAEYSNGATGVFVTSTGDAPGTNRFEISGDMGKIVVEDEKLVFWRLRQSEREYNRTYKGGFGIPECWKCEIPLSGKNREHVGITEDWVESILTGKPMLAPGKEGINGLMLSNSMYLSSWLDSWVELPIDEDKYFSMLQEKIRTSRAKQNVVERTLDVKGTH
jgi:predicted dehydrogenase